MAKCEEEASTTFSFAGAIIVVVLVLPIKAGAMKIACLEVRLKYLTLRYLTCLLKCENVPMGSEAEEIPRQYLCQSNNRCSYTIIINEEGA